jgi:anti-anti-sigma factor
VKIESLTGDITVFSVRGEPELGGELQAISEMIAGDIGGHVIVNFVCVDIIRSSSLTKLLKLRQALISRSRYIVLINIQPLTQSIMEITDLNRVFTIAANKEAGVSLIQSNKFAHVS